MCNKWNMMCKWGQKMEAVCSCNFKESQIWAKTTLDYTNKWFLVNGLTLNIDKANTIKFSSKHYQDETFLINYQNNSINKPTNTKFPGLELDKHTHWNNHVNKSVPKLCSARFVVRSIYSYSNTSTLKKIYVVYCHSTMKFGILSWRN
jgi:hypothetical protein